MTYSATFPEREYRRRCAMCGFIAPQDYPWEERLAHMTNCPQCGIPLERLACHSCGAPTVVLTGYGFMGNQSIDMFHCGWCGEPVTMREPRMREKPRVAPTARAGEFLVREDIARVIRKSAAQLFGPPHFTIEYDAGEDRHPPSAVTGAPVPWAGCGCKECDALRHKARRPMASTEARIRYLNRKRKAGQ